MSLKHFHIAFIALVTFTAWAFAAWIFLTRGLPTSFTVMGVISFLGGFALLVYGIKFYKKAKTIIT